MTRNYGVQRESPPQNKRIQNKKRVFVPFIINHSNNPIFPIEPLSHGGIKIILNYEKDYFVPTWQTML